MRCLLIAPSGPDLSVLLAVLAARAVDVDFTSDIAAGVGLADVDLDQFDFAVAVIPADRGESSAGLPAIYVEIGVAAARELPLLVVVESPGPPSPALAGLTTVTTQMGNEEALRLQLGLFLRWVQATPRARRIVQPPASSAHLVPAVYAARLRAARISPPDQRGLAFEQLVSDLLRDGGAQLEQRPPGGPDLGVDITAFIPGEEQRLGTLMVQVKSGTLAGPIAGHQQPPAEHVDGFVECVVGMRDRPGEVSGDGQLHGGKTGRLAVLADQDVHGLPSVGEHWSLAAACQQGHGLFLSSWRGAPAVPASSR